MSRRNVVKAVSVGAAALVGAGAKAAPPASARIVHHVFFWLKEPGSAAHRDQLVAGLRGLAKIPVIRSLEIGVPASTEQRDVVDSSFDVSELMLFDSVADQKIYQDHPVHRDFVAKCSHLWDRVVVYDTRTL